MQSSSSISYSLLDNIKLGDFYLAEMASSKELTTDYDYLSSQITNIYAQYDFKFSCSFRQHRGLKLLAYAKPLIQYFLDQLIIELREKKHDNPMPARKLENLIDAFTPMYLNRLARVSDKILLSDPRVQLMRNDFQPLPGSGRFEPFVVQIQNVEFVEYLNFVYPDLFPNLFQISRNWLDFVLAFSVKLKP